MRGSLFPNGVNVDHAALRRTETTKAEEILRNRLNWTSRGMYTGGVITVNTTGAPPYLHIDVAQLSGFTPSGDFIETSSDYYDISLDDETNGVVNLVCAVYTESEIHRQPHETDGETWPTHSEGAWRIRVYSAANYAALPTTDGNLASDAKDRCLIVGEVTANGPASSLTASSIEGPATFSNILYANPRIPVTIPGVTISGVSPGMSTGLGTLDYTWAVGPVYGLQWISFAGGAGAVVNPTVDGAIDVLDGAGEFLTLEIVISQLSTISPISEAIDIINMYEQDIPRLTGEDDLHRNMQGTGTPTPQNPHGQTLDDFGGASFGLLEEHQDVMHAVGIWRGSSPAIFSGSITFPMGGDLFSIMSPALSDLYYINGRKLNTLTPLSFQFTPSVIPSSASGSHFYEIFADDDGVAGVTLKMSFPDPRTVSGCWIVDASDEYPVGAADLALTVTNPAGIFQYAFSWDGGENVTANDTQLPHIIRLFASDAKKWIDVYVNTVGGVANPDGVLPGLGVYSDVITIFASADLSQNLPIASVCGWYDALTPRFKIGYAPYSGTRDFVDKRIWGTLATENIADSALQELVYSPQDELHYSGILYSRSALHDNFEIWGAAALNINIRGGAYYCRGERIDYGGDTGYALIDNTVNLLYLNPDGQLGLLDVTVDFVGMSEALEYLLGRSQLMEDGHTSQYPERGVPLFEFTTAGGAITNTQNLMRNVNGPVEPWSVAMFTAQTHPVSAFDNLRAAFLYAGLAAGECEITLTGPSFITEKIVQPLGVNVRGVVHGSIAMGVAYGSVVSIAAIDATGIWELSAGCKVKDVYIDMQADAGAVIEVADNTEVSGCTYVSGTPNADVFCISALAVSNVRVEGNTVTTLSGAVVLTHANCSNISVTGNIINQTANNSGLGYGLIDVVGTNLYIDDNTLTTDNSVDFTTGINIASGSSQVHITGNALRIGDGTAAAAAAEYGIRLVDNVFSAWVNNNFISRVVGDTSQVGIGISSEAGSDVFISENTIYSLGVGIQFYSSVGAPVFTNIQVCKNDIVACYHRGIDFDITAAHTPVMSGIQVDGNRIFSMTKGAAGLLVFGAQLFGIRFEVMVVGAGHTTYFEGISFSNNSLSWLDNAADGTWGIYAQHLANIGDATTVLGLRINDNQVVDFMADGGPDAAGVFVDFANLDTTRGATVSNNVISTTSSVSNVGSAVWGIAVSLDECCIDGNVVKILGTTTAKQGSGILSAGTRSVVSSNVVRANWVGISNLGPGAVVNSNQIEAYGVGILNDVAATLTSIKDNTVDVTTVNSVITVQPADSCGCIVGGGDVSILDNTLSISGSGVPINVPDYCAHIYVASTSAKICGNKTRLGNTLKAVGGVSGPGSGNPAYHIFFGSTGAINNALISDNFVNNFDNVGGAKCVNGIWFEDLGGVTSLTHVTVNSNHIRGSNLMLPAPGAAAWGDYPFEYCNLLQVLVGSSYAVTHSNTILAEGAGALDYPAIYWANAATQQPFQGAPLIKSSWATKLSPVAYW